MRRAAGDVGHPQSEQCGFRVFGFKAFGDQMVERMPDQRLNKVVGRVMGAGGRALVAATELKSPLASFASEFRLEFKQSLVDRAEFLNVEGGVVHADEVAAVGMPVEAEGTQAAEQHIVAERAIG